MSKILCVYYSRSGKTKAVMEEIAQELEAELVEIHDRVDRNGMRGWLRCGLDAMRRTTQPLEPFHTERALSDYQLVILGTPVWAGRCSSVMRGFLKNVPAATSHIFAAVTLQAAMTESYYIK